jgi:hypothetical protein
MHASTMAIPLSVGVGAIAYPLRISRDPDSTGEAILQIGLANRSAALTALTASRESFRFGGP